MRVVSIEVDLVVKKSKVPVDQAHLASNAMRPLPRHMQTKAKVIRPFDDFIIRGLRRISWPKSFSGDDFRPRVRELIA